MCIDFEPLADLAGADEVSIETDRDKTADIAAAFGLQDFARAEAHGIVGERRDQAAMREAARITMGLGNPQADKELAVGASGIERLPRIGEAGLFEMRRIAGGHVHGCHCSHPLLSIAECRPFPTFSNA